MRRLKAEEKQAKADREKRLARLRSVCTRAREKLRESCASRRDATRAEARGKVGAAKQSRKQLREDYREIKAIDAEASKRRRRHKALPAEAKRESDDEVRQGIPPELVPIFDTVRRSIKGTPRLSRTEAFLHWADEHENEVIEMMDAAVPADDQFAEAYAAWAAEGAA
jgi:septation ring formation regulator EzrA